MPNSYLKKLVSEGRGSLPELEKKWEDAKAKAAKAGHKDDYAYVTSIFQRLAGVAASIDFSGQTASHEMVPGTPVGAIRRLRANSLQGPITPVQTGINMGQMTTADNNYLDSLVDSGQFTREEVNDAWEDAKKTADANAKKNPNIVPSYAYTTSIFQSKLGIKPNKAEATVQINAATRLRSLS
jgi:hypothetical protein